MNRSPSQFVRPPAHTVRLRAGISLIELLCAATILSATMLVLVPLLARVHQVRSHLRAREAVVRELANIIEQVRAGGRPSPGEFETVGTRVVNERLVPALDDARLTVQTKDQPEDAAVPQAKLDQQQRIVLAIDWTGEQGVPQSIALTCWIPVAQAAAAGEAP